MRKTSPLLAIALTLAHGPVASAQVRAATDPVRLVTLASQDPSVTYQAHAMVTHWYGDKTTAEEVEIYYRPPNRYRLEFLRPDGKLDRVVLSDGRTEEVQIVRDGKSPQSYVSKMSPRLLSREKEKDLILLNYRASLQGRENFLGRPVWAVELMPLSTGKPVQTMRIDAATNVILEIKRTAGSVGSITRFTRFEPKKSLDEKLFLPIRDRIGAHDDLASAPGPDPKRGYQGTLPGGFSLESVDLFEIRGKSVRHMRYTDGLMPLSVFETPVAVRLPNEGLDSHRGANPVQLGAGRSGQVRSWKSGRSYFTLIGDFPQDVLREIALNVK